MSITCSVTVADHVDRNQGIMGHGNLVRNTEVLNVVAADVAFGNVPERVAILSRHDIDLRLTFARRVRTLEVQMTSRRLMFILLSQLTKWPL